MTELERHRFTNQQLFTKLFGNLLRREEIQLNILFRNTLQRIVVAKVYHDTCLRSALGRYNRWGCWARTQPAFARLPKNEFRRVCAEVNQACHVYDGWDVIVRNLTDPRSNNIDTRKLSINQL